MIRYILSMIFAASLIALTACTSSTSHQVSINGVTLDYVKHGKGNPLYLLHGGMESRESFQHQIPVLSKYYTLIALDSREQGRSSRSDQQISYDLMAQDVIALAAHLNHDRISLIGSSDGAITALTVAIEKPELVNRLVLSGANYNVSAYSEDTLAFLSNYEWDGNTDNTKYPGIFIEHYNKGHDTLEDFGDLLKEMTIMWTSSPNYTVEDVRKVTAHTLIINGDHEDMPLEHTVSLYKALPNANLFVVPDGNHYSLEEKPDLLNTVILDFMRDQTNN